MNILHGNQHTAVMVADASGDMAAGMGGQEYAVSANLYALAETVERHILGDLLESRGGKVGVKVRVGGAGGYAVYADAGWTKLLCHSLFIRRQW